MSSEDCTATVIDPYEALSRLSCLGKPVCFDPPPLQPFQSESVEPARKRRKREPVLSRADAENREYHAELMPWLAPAIARARQSHLDKAGVSSWYGNFVEMKPKDASSDVFQPLLGLPDKELDERIVSLDEEISRISAKQLTSFAYINESETVKKVVLDKQTAQTFLIPPRSAFLIARLQQWQLPLETLEGIDLVILDPPWPNASASRSDSYETFDIYELLQFDLPSLLKEASDDKDTLVAVWVTNKPKFRRFVLDKLFKAWDIEPVATSWLWVKITAGSLEEGGKSVWPLSNEHRRCYEGVLLGRFKAAPSVRSLPKVPERNVLLSVPLGHSRKPPLLDLVRPYLADAVDPTVLELFARTTLSTGGTGMWISAGDEAIKFNAERYWTSS